MEGSGITIRSQGEGCELTESYHIALYDKPAKGEEVVRVHRTTTVVAPKTGDETPLGIVAGLMALGVLAIIGIEFGKRKIN
jgi:LPXTG-motif cell wall-anchored protein